MPGKEVEKTTELLSDLAPLLPWLSIERKVFSGHVSGKKDS